MASTFHRPHLLVLAVALLCAPPALAQEDGRASNWRLSVEANTDFPLSVGSRVGAEFPYRLRVSTSLGWLPRPYLRAISLSDFALGAPDGCPPLGLPRRPPLHSKGKPG